MDAVTGCTRARSQDMTQHINDSHGLLEICSQHWIRAVLTGQEMTWTIKSTEQILPEHQGSHYQIGNEIIGKQINSRGVKWYNGNE